MDQMHKLHAHARVHTFIHLHLQSANMPASFFAFTQKERSSILTKMSTHLHSFKDSQ